MNKNINEYVNNIVGTIKYFNWKLTQIWIENNCIYCERIRLNGQKQNEGLYAGSDEDLNDVYNVFNKLRYVLNFNGMLNDDNVMI